MLNGIITIEECEDLFTGNEDSEKMLKIIKMLFTLSRISIPLIIIGMGSMDFVKCIFSGNEDGMKKAQSKFMKRILIGVVIFLVPSLLQYILEIAHHVALISAKCLKNRITHLLLLSFSGKEKPQRALQALLAFS